MAPSSTPIPGSSEPDPSESGFRSGSGAPAAGSSARRQELGEDEEKPRAIAGLSEEVVAAAITACWSAIWNIFFMAESHHAIAAFSGLYFDFSLINK